MKKITYILPLFVAALLISCGGEETTTEDTSPETSQEKEGTTSDETTTTNLYSIDPSTAAVKWTGFKTPEKIGVDGEFKTFSLSGYNNNAPSIWELMTGTEITLDISSTKTGDEARDGKIINSFFGSMTNTEQIVASITTMEANADDQSKGIAQVEISMNDVTFTQGMSWTYREDLGMFILSGVVNVSDWNAITALDKLTEVCFEKHQGKTWPDVEVRANVKVTVAPAEGV
ncbi:YceI family protein [Parvicella tangerina]|uniref:Lipid/polyisoprenoid-binding YceI-like domain-containing protein n=1 Tax=Parvicella tangerina TaxID=2829795 RepID=A0A916JQC3_9FLAO|nr:YceI family protein [Parvicella tangerina]CAG5086638.1 hypothetical protein CRYO30217_03215 [Parvicella tangerina]